MQVNPRYLNSKTGTQTDSYTMHATGFVEVLVVTLYLKYKVKINNCYWWINKEWNREQH